MPLDPPSRDDFAELEAALNEFRTAQGASVAHDVALARRVGMIVQCRVYDLGRFETTEETVEAAIAQALAERAQIAKEAKA